MRKYWVIERLQRNGSYRATGMGSYFVGTARREIREVRELNPREKYRLIPYMPMTDIDAAEKHR